MNSLEWRAKKLENRIIGGAGCRTHSYEASGQETPICDQLKRISKLYQNFVDANGEKYSRFLKLYQNHKRLLDELDSPAPQVSDAAKAELVLAYENDLVGHLESVKHMADKADKVLDESKWPDLTRFQERLMQLETITRDQHLQSVNLDQRTEELIEIYNEIITKFKSNTVIWNQKLEAHENEDRKMDEDE